MAALKYDALLKIIAEFYNWRCVYFVRQNMQIRKRLYSRKERRSGIKVEPCNMLLLMLLVCIRIYLQSVLVYVCNFGYLSFEYSVFMSAKM
jgi:hypothetical protein